MAELALGTAVIWSLPWSPARTVACIVTELCPIEKKGDQERYRVCGPGWDCYAFRVDLQDVTA